LVTAQLDLDTGQSGGHRDAMSTPLTMPWARGPEAGTDDAVLVSVTDFAVHRVRDVPGIAVAGLRLRSGWYGMEGAVVLSLWSLPLERRSGSISVWRGEDDLRRFIRLPAHVEIMRRYRDRGSLRADTWRVERFISRTVTEQARRWIAAA
jgi:hypothetical protein